MPPYLDTSKTRPASEARCYRMRARYLSPRQCIVLLAAGAIGSQLAEADPRRQQEERPLAIVERALPQPSTDLLRAPQSVANPTRSTWSAAVFPAPSSSRPSTGWEDVFTEDFEGDWPGPWEIFDRNFQSGDDFWERITCAPGGAASGTGAAWCAANGDQLLCGPTYDDNMNSWMIFGPFNLSYAVEAEVVFKFINDCEVAFDGLSFLASIDGIFYYGFLHDGTTTGYPSDWQSAIFDLRQVPVIGDLTGQPLVWFSLIFESDSTQSGFGGAYVDDIIIRRLNIDPCSATLTAPADAAEACFPETFTWSTTGSCRDLRLAFRADPASTTVIVVPVTGGSKTIDALTWEEINIFIGSSPVYYWTIGELYENYFFARAPWRPFTVCLPCPASGDCCTPHPTTGCNDGSCCATVCPIDAFCCVSQWDSTCATLASEHCGCLLCGNGDCGPNEDCSSCPDDCSFTGTTDDCNSNGVPDGCDIQIGTSADCNLDGMPDSCDGTVCPDLDDNEAFTTSEDKLWNLDLGSGFLSLLGTASARWLHGLSFDPTTADLWAVERDKVAILDHSDASVLWNGAHGVFILDTPAGLAIDALGNVLLVHDETIYSIDKSTGQATSIGSLAVNNANGLAFAPDGNLYAVGELDGLNGAQGMARLDPADGAVLEVIGAVPNGINAIDFDSRGVLYLASENNDALYTMSLSDASVSQVGGLAVGGRGLAIFRDCNENGTHDAVDVMSGTSPDMDGNGIPDGCPACRDGACESGEDSCTCPSDCGQPAGSETPNSTCADGLDNDCDGLADCADGDCFFDATCLPPPTPGGPGDILLSTSVRAYRYDGVTGEQLHEFLDGADLSNPGDLAIGPDGRLYVAGESSRNVVSFELERGFRYGPFVEFESGGLFSPWGLEFGPDGHLYVSDRKESKVVRFDGTTGDFIDEFIPSGAGGLNIAGDLIFGPDGNLYIASVEGHAVLRFHGTTGSFLDTFVPTNSGGLIRPYGLTFGDDGNLYVTHHDFQGGVFRYSGATGAFIDRFVPPGSGGLRFPYGLAFGPSGDLYVTSELVNGVLRFDGQTGQFRDASIFGRGSGSAQYILFQPAECSSDGDCDDSDPQTSDVCYTHACANIPFLRLYVDAGAAGANDGSSWPDAFTDPQDALDAAVAVDGPIEVWVAAGVYTPDRETGDRRATFQLQDGVSLYGGFFGTETSLDQRDPLSNLTVLSGDLRGDDGPNFANFDDNSYHVVRANGSGRDAPALLDGFIVYGGNATGRDFEPGMPDRGGGILVVTGSPTIERCTFLNNTASIGGAIFCEDQSRMTVANTFVQGNSALSGGGVTVWGTCTARIVNCVFAGNQATDGAALSGRGGNTTVTNCTIADNVATSQGGGISNTESLLTVTNSILWGNVDASGTGESAQLSGSNWDVNYCCVQGWTGALGGVGNTGDCEPFFVNPNGRDGTAGTIDDDLSLAPQSPNIDRGFNLADIDATALGFQELPPTDIVGNPRKSSRIVDRGAYEFQYAIPATSAWTLLVLGLGLLAGGTVVLRRRRTV